MLIAPKKEWAIVESENEPHGKVFVSYLLLLALIPAAGSFIGYGLIGHSVFGVHVGSVSWGIRQAIVQFATMAGGVYITAFVINLLADTFGSVKNFDRAFSLVAYSYTPMCVAGVLYIIPALSTLASLAGLYGLYMLYTGLQPMMKTPPDKVTAYFVVSLIGMVVVSVVVSAVLAVILIRGLYF
jgi:hypothetical protein